MKHFATLFILFYLALCGMASAQTKGVVKTISTDSLTEGFTLPSAKTITVATGATIVINGLTTLADDVKITFNPGATNAGLNVGSIAGDPSTPANGDMWYDSTANELTARINGANVSLGAGGTPGGSNTQLQYNNAGAFGGLANGTGLLTNDGAGVFTYTATTTGSGGGAGLANKIPLYDANGRINSNGWWVYPTAGGYPYINALNDNLWFKTSASDSIKLLFSPAPSGAFVVTVPAATGTIITTGNLSSITATGTITSGTWNGTAITDAYVSDTLTASLFVGSGSTTNAIDLATAEVAGTLPFANGGTGEGTAPLDPYKHELLGAYSTARRLLTGYDAKTIFRVRESAGNLEADVPVTSSGDTTSVMTSLVGSNSGYIKSFRNQLSVPGAWPEFYNATTTTQMRTIDAGTQDTINSKTAMFNAKDATRTLACTSTTAGNSWAAIVVCRYTGDASTQAIAAGNGTYYLAFHNSNGKMYLAAAGTLGTTLFSYDNAHANAHWAKFENLVQVWAVTVKDGKQEMYINGWKAGATTAAGNYPLALTNFGYSGTSNITWKGQLAELVLFSSADAAGFIPAMQSMCSYYAAKPLVVLAGDSLTTGSGATGSPLQTYGMQLHDTSDYILHMVATIGHTADQVTTALNGTNNTNYSPRYSGDTIKNATVCWAGVNDLINGDSVATLQSDLTALWAQQRAAGFKVVACTLIGCIDNGSLVQQDLIDINAWIRTQTSSYDALADLGANANIGVGQHLDASYFHTDNIHLDSTGYGVAAGLIKTALDAIYP